MSKPKVSIEDIMTVLFHPILGFKIVPEKSALLLINFLDYTDLFVKTAVEAGMSEVEVNEALNDFDLRAKKAVNNAGKLLKTCRDRGFEIVHVISEATAEKTKQDAKANRKIGLIVPSGEESLKIYEEVAPKKGELVFSKANGGAFTGTRLDFVLRNMNVDSLIVCGLMTDQDVLLSTIQGVDLGYNVMLVEDACTTFTTEAHESFIKWFKTFVYVKTTDEVFELIQKSDDANLRVA